MTTATRYTFKPATNGQWRVHDEKGPVHEPESLRLAKARARRLNKAAKQ